MLLFTYFIVYILIVFVLRTILLKKKTGINAITFDKADDAHGFNGKMFLIIALTEFAVVSIYALKNDWYEYMLPFWYLESAILQNIGWILLLISLPIVWISQSQMASSWRVGIDKINTSKLVTNGIFSISRNPIFLGVIVANIGLFFVIPNAFTLMIISLSTLCINTQIRVEEAFLRNEFGAQYIEYSKKVRRWI